MKFLEKEFSNRSGIKTKYFDTEIQKPALIFIHGGRTHPLGSYRGILEILSSQYRIIAPELPGFVNDYYPPHYLDLHETAIFLREIMGSLKIKSYYSVGHSLGGGIAILMAFKNPKNKKIIAVNSSGYPLEISEKRLALSMIYKMVRQGYSKQGIKVIKKVYKDLKDTANGKKYGKKGASYSLKSATYSISKNYSSLFKKVEAEALIIHSSKDNLFKKYSAQYLSDLLVNSQLKTVSGHHDWIMYEQEKFTQIAFNFLKKNNQ